jgi:hypothetical protein
MNNNNYNLCLNYAIRTSHRKRRFLPEEPAVLHKGRYLHLVSCERRSLRIDAINAVEL